MTARSIRQTSRGIIAIAAVGLALACGSDSNQNAAPTGLPMGQTPAAEKRISTARATGNTPPTIASVVLRPEEPRPGERLTAFVEASDAEGDEMRLDFEWTVDGVRIANSTSELMLQDVRKGSYITVEVVASDSEGVSRSYQASVTVGNRPPVLQGVVLEPLGEVSASNDVTAVPRSYDPDGDDVTYEYSWRINGEPARSEGAVLSAREFERGDEITLEVVANDGEGSSEPLVSAGIKVVNANPRITSSPAGFGGERFVYLVKVDDPDGDRRLRFHLQKGPDGMTIDNLGGKIRWNPSSGQEGAHPVEVVVVDGQGGEARQNFEIDLSFEDEVPASPGE